ncbi:MAG: hypothetical protein WKF30_02905 [Pyrinomonadaceae bacterium]
MFVENKRLTGTTFRDQANSRLQVVDLASPFSTTDSHKYTVQTICAIIIAMTLTGVASAQSTTGTVTMSATVSKFVELNSGGAITLSGNSGGGVTTDGTVNNPLAAVVNLGELGPSNTNSFVTANVPLKIRSNAAYVLSVNATVTSTGTTTNKISAVDVGFGLGVVTRTGTGVNTTGTDTNATSGDPTLVANGSINATSGRYEFTATRSNLSAFSTSTTALNGTYIMNAVPRSNGNGLTVPAIFAVKPQFFENGSTTVSVTFTVTAP